MLSQMLVFGHFAQKMSSSPGKGNLCSKYVILAKNQIQQRWHILGKDDFFWAKMTFLGEDDQKEAFVAA